MKKATEEKYKTEMEKKAEVAIKNSGKTDNEKKKKEPVKNDKKIGRNDPCPCGSGKKYKKCHGAPGAAPL